MYKRGKAMNASLLLQKTNKKNSETESDHTDAEDHERIKGADKDVECVRLPHWPQFQRDRGRRRMALVGVQSFANAIKVGSMILPTYLDPQSES
jgi:hypothetical protein